MEAAEANGDVTNGDVNRPPSFSKSSHVEPTADMAVRQQSAVMPAFLINLVAFGISAWLAFARNVHALFFHYDGSYMLVDVRNQLMASRPTFEFTNDFLQSIGNIQFTQNARLLFFFWPVGWFSDPDTGKIASYLIVALIAFLAAYGIARLLSLPNSVALAAGWISGFVATPFVPLPFFYPIIEVAPGFIVIAGAPVGFFALARAAGRYGALADVLIASGFVALAGYLLAASVLSVPLLAPAVAVYVALAILLSKSRSELLRKIVVLAAALVIMIALRWPWYVYGLFSDSAPYFFPKDFLAVYNQTIYASVVFHNSAVGIAGPCLVAFAAAGALLSLRRPSEQRAAASVLLVVLALLAAAGAAMVLTPQWILPPPIYLEVGLWPLYAAFAAVALQLAGRFLVEKLVPERMQGASLVSGAWILLAVAAAWLVMSRPPTNGAYPFPPALSPVASVLESAIALHRDSGFKGRVATIAPVKPGAVDAWSQQFAAAFQQAGLAGNDEMSVGLWYYHIPTLFEYNQFTSPVFHALTRRALQPPGLIYPRNITIVSETNIRVLQLLGVRYALMPRQDTRIGEVRATEDRLGQPWDLMELPDPNLATYSPTIVETRRDLASTLDFVLDETVDLTKRAVTQDPIADELTPLRSSALTMAGPDLHVTAESTGRSLVVVPVEFSHCMVAQEALPAAAGLRVLRVDGLLTGIVFDRVLDLTLSFRTGPLRNPLCRWRDYQDVKAMLQ
jgi:hypothetical protein